MTDFNSPIARRRTGSLKWDKRADLDPFWVADMDFQSPPEILEALHARIDHGVFGYALPKPTLLEALQSYLQARLEVTVPEEQIVHLGGLVPALSLAARAFGKPGEALLTCTPSYPPFLGIHRDAGLELQSVDHLEVAGKWTFDWEGLEAKVTPATKLFILSNPQNPLGRVFSREEVIQLATFCQKHDLILVSDEIHCDLILEEDRTPHFSALNLSEDLRKGTITLLAPSKTYNIAGLGYAFAVIPDPKTRTRFTAARGHTLPEINCLAYEAAEAAYRHGEPWRQELLAHLRQNRQLIRETLGHSLPSVAMPEIEATYLAWLDCTGLPESNPNQRLEEAGLFLSDGDFFGKGRCVRLNFGTQTDRLCSALETMVEVLAPTPVSSSPA